MEEQYYGVIEERYNDKDWLASDFVLPRAPKGTSSFLLNGAVQYAQNEVSRVSCTITGAMGAYTDLTGYKFPLEARLEIWQEALVRGANPSIGWFIISAVDLVRDWVNKHCEDKVDYLRMEVGSETFHKAKRKGYTHILGYRGNPLYKADREDNGVIDKVEFGTTTYGHCLRGCYFVGHLRGYASKVEQIIDSYPERSTNLYFVPQTNWKPLVQNQVYFRHSYIYVLQ